MVTKLYMKCDLTGIRVRVWYSKADRAISPMKQMEYEFWNKR